MDDKTPKKVETVTVSAQDRGETMAFALQNGIYNIAANFYEPYVSYLVQRRFAPPHAKPSSYGNYAQNLGGEFAGDVIGASALVLAEALMPQHLHSFTRSFRSKVDPLYASVARNIFAKDLNTPDYDRKVQEWKDFQERNLVRSMIMAGAGIAGNVAVQKYLLKNPSPTNLVFAGKLVSRSLTLGVNLGARLAFPEQFDRADEWVSNKFFAPMMDAQQIKLEEKEETPATEEPKTHVEKLAASRAQQPEENTLGITR